MRIVFNWRQAIDNGEPESDGDDEHHAESQGVYAASDGHDMLVASRAAATAASDSASGRARYKSSESQPVAGVTIHEGIHEGSVLFTRVLTRVANGHEGSDWVIVLRAAAAAASDCGSSHGKYTLSKSQPAARSTMGWLRLVGSIKS